MDLSLKQYLQYSIIIFITLIAYLSIPYISVAQVYYTQARTNGYSSDDCCNRSYSNTNYYGYPNNTFTNIYSDSERFNDSGRQQHYNNYNNRHYGNPYGYNNYPVFDQPAYNNNGNNPYFNRNQPNPYFQR